MAAFPAPFWVRMPCVKFARNPKAASTRTPGFPGWVWWCADRTPDQKCASPSCRHSVLSLNFTSLNLQVELRFVKFQNVTKLTMFVVDNQDDTETTTISSLRLIGQPREKTDMSEFKRVSGHVGERE